MKHINVNLRFLILMTISIAGCGDTSKKSEILPNPNKVYEDQCYVWLKEMPDFFRERNYLAGGLAWDRHSYQGVYVSDNPKSMFYSRHYVGQTVVLFKPDQPGGNMNRANIIYQYSISQGNDGDMDQIWVFGEFKPPEDCKQWVIAGTGKHRGIRAEGVWHWHWPENRNWLKPENPPGYDYPNAEEFNYQYPEKTSGQSEMLSHDYWIEDPPYGVNSEEPVLGLPAIQKPAQTKRKQEIGYFLIRKIPDLQQRQLLPPGNKSGDPEEKTGFDHFNFDGIYQSDDPASPFHNLPISGKLMAIHTPVNEEDMHPDNIHCEYLCIQCGEPEGDQIWWWGESFPPMKSQLTLKVATGKWVGLSGIGTWHHDYMEGFDLALACEFTFDIPIK